VIELPDPDQTMLLRKIAQLDTLLRELLTSSTTPVQFNLASRAIELNRSIYTQVNK